ncbi:unnamed protein product [Prorocentrum cordatum]|uniref:Myosin motor domain-containing protein n=1 Tax=Prorocentrum cordatum TaxID=2364126 RepID=A0ABN9WCK3_9DINO|nr:unnamed protein product [Polarella glacialis]
MPVEYWVPDDLEVFVPCTHDGGEFSPIMSFVPSGGLRLKKDAKVADLDQVQPDQLEGIDRLDKLHVCHAPAILHALRIRYARQQIYTAVQRMIVAVNPFRKVDCCSPEVRLKYLAAERSKDLEPSVFSVGLDAVGGLRHPEQSKRRSQAVLISGESGAGKTECAKLVLDYVTLKIQADDMKKGGKGRASLCKPQIQEQIMKTNPVLEAFGNAMTARNNNSSRFGKWLQMPVSQKEGIQGCSITDYVLEVSRVCSQSKKDRNYHVFFQLLAGKASGDDLFEGVEMLQAGQYSFLTKGNLEAPGIDDSTGFRELKDAFGVLGIQRDSQVEIIKVAMGILTLGNLTFATDPASNDDAAQLTDPASGKMAADLLGVDPEELRKAILVFTGKAGAETITKERKKSEADRTRDSLARVLYGKLFKWLITKINSLLGQGMDSPTFFGVLDIAGFESFEANSLEQLFINLTNELLQGHFNDYFFEAQKQEYKAEGLTVEVSFKDNTDVVALVGYRVDKGASKQGILDVLDDSAKTATADDQAFYNQLKKVHEQHERMVWPKVKSLDFTVRHFAGDVKYTATGFREKNSDRPPESTGALLAGSSLSLLREVAAAMAEGEEEEQQRGRAGGARRAKTLNASFQASLGDLMAKLREAEPHFVRCIKPNKDKVPSIFESKLAYEQLSNTGVVEAMRIRQDGLPIRLEFEDFLGKYRAALPDAGMLQTGQGGPMDDASELVQAFVNLQYISEEQVQVGKSKVFATMAGTHSLDRALHGVVKNRLREALEDENVEELEKQIQSACEVRLGEREPALVEARRGLAELRCRQSLADATQAYDHAAMSAAVAEAEGLGLAACPELDACREAKAQWEKAKEQRDALEQTLSQKGKKPRAEFMKHLEAAIEEGKRAGLTDQDCRKAAEELAAESRRLKASEAIAQAIKSRRIAGLRKAVEEGQKSGMEPEELRGAEQLADELERSARSALQEALEHCKMGPLEKAIGQARAVGMPEGELGPALAALQVEQAKADAKRRLHSAVQRGSVAGLTAALQGAQELGLAEAEPEAVQECSEALERAHRREQARADIARALEAGRTQQRPTLERLEALLREALEAGLPEDAEEVQGLRGALELERRREAVRELLRAAVEGGSVEAIEAAIAKGEELDMVAEDLAGARAAIVLERRREAARDGLAAAMRKRTVDALRAAIAEAEACGLSENELRKPRECFEADSARDQVRANLAKAAQSRDTALLEVWLAKAKELGMSKAEVREAEKVLAAERSKDETKARLKSVAKAKPLDMEELVAALQEAEMVGLTAAECRPARKILEQELRKVAARRGAEEAAEFCSGPVAPGDEGAHAARVQRLQKAIQVGEQALLEASELLHVSQLLQEESAREAARQRLAEAVRGGGVAALREALAEAEEARMEKWETQAARDALQDLQRKAQASAAIRTAINCDDAGAISSAIVEGTRAGLEPAELDRAREAHRAAQRRADARGALQEAARARRLSALGAAIAEAAAAEVPGQEVAEAQAVLRQEELKAAARDEIERAGDLGQVEPLQAALDRAEEAGLEAAETAAGRALLARLRRCERARQGLENAVAAGDVGAMQAAIAEACAAGLDSAEIAPWQKALAVETRKGAAREELAAAVRMEVPQAITAAIEEAVAAGLEEFELHQARQLLRAEVRRAAARDALAEASGSGDVQALREAVVEGESAGVDHALLEMATARLREEEGRAAARTALQMATASCDPGALRAALEQGREAALDTSELRDARAALRAEERRAAAREALQEAVRTRNVAAVEDALVEGKAAGVEERILAPARDLQLRMESAAAARAQLSAATSQRDERALRAALAAGRSVGLSGAEMDEAQRVLEEEERRSRARHWLAEALEGRQVHVFEAVLDECAAAGVRNAPELALLRRVLAARARLSQAMKGDAGSSELRGAISDCEAPDLAALCAAELPPARRLLEERRRREWALAELGRLLAVGSPDLGALRAAVAEGSAAGLGPAELAEARQVLERQQALGVARDRICDAGRDPDFLREAIAKGRSAGLDESELVEAQATLEREERRRDALLALRRAVETAHLGDLRAAVRGAEAAGLQGGPELAQAGALLRAGEREAAREHLAGVAIQGDADELLEALGKGQECGLDESELEGVRASLEEATELAFTRVKDGLLPPADELAFEVAGRQLQSPGHAGLDRKTGEAPLVLDAGVGERLARAVEQMWHRKQASILDELKHNLRGCSTKLGKAQGVRAVSNRLMLRLCFELGSRYGGRASGHLRQLPLLMLSALLYTQEDVDTDRMMLFPDCPARGSGTPQEQRIAYGAYRDRIKDVWVLQEGRAERNPSLSAELSRALRMVLESSLSGAGQTLLAKWVKVLCVFGAAADALPPTSVSAALVGLPRDAAQLLQSKRPGDSLVWAGPLSATTDHAIPERQLRGAGAGAVHLRIEGLTEGLGLSAVSQYPEESEVLVPPFALLAVKEVRKQADQTLCVTCEFKGTLLSQRVREASRADLLEASAQLLRQLSFQDAGDLCGERPEEASRDGAWSPRPPGSAEGASPQRSDASPVRRAPAAATAARGKQPRGQPSSRPQVAFGRPPGATPAAAAAGRARTPPAVGRARTPPAVGRAPGAAARPGRRYNDDFRALFGVFEAMDRRGACAVSREDFLWAKVAFERTEHGLPARCPQGVHRGALLPEPRGDMTLHRFFCLAMPGASEPDIGEQTSCA